MKRSVALPVIVALLLVAGVLIVYALKGGGQAAPGGTLLGSNEQSAAASKYPLHDAVARGNLERVKELLATGVEVNAQLPAGGAELPGGGSIGGATPLVLAAAGPSTEMVRTLVTGGARVDAGAGDGTTPLIAAVRSGPVSTVQFLAPESSIDARDQAGQSAAMIAVQTGQADKLILLLNEGASVESATADGTTLLGLAASSGGTQEATKVLLEAGAKVDAADGKGVTPLMKAAARDDVPKVFLLLDAGASASARDAAGRSVLDYARTQSGVKKVESIQVLVSAGAT